MTAETPRSIEEARREIAAAGFSDPDGVVSRLEAFTPSQVVGVRRRMAGVGLGRWPDIAGCLVVLFSSRVGSTYLARELETRFRMGRLRETFNTHRVEGLGPAQIVKVSGEEWFSFKAGASAVVTAELSGFFDAHLERSAFMVLVRRDITAQAVSIVKARQTGQYHSNQSPSASPVYDGAEIAKYVGVIAASVERIRDYARRSERPRMVIAYEDFVDGDFTAAEEICDLFGVPRRRAGEPFQPMPVQRIGDEVNLAWRERFQDEMDSQTRRSIDTYNKWLVPK